MSKSLLPPNATALERHIEKVTARVSEIPSPLRELWNPDTCPVHLLPWLAWSLGVTTWKSYWPVSVRRSILRSAIETKRRQGTVQSVRTVVESFGAGVELQEDWQLGAAGVPHRFAIDIIVSQMGDEPVTSEFQRDIIDEVSRIKPSRSFFTLTTDVVAHSSIGIVAAARAATYTRLEVTDA